MNISTYLKTMVYEPYWAALKRLQTPIDKYELWRKTADNLGLSKEARFRLEWFIFYRTKASQNATLTCRHFAIPRSQFYYWFNRFTETNVRSLEDQSTAPHRTRQRQISGREEQSAIALRKEHIHWGKMKLTKLYQNTYGEKLSSWQFQQVIRIYRLYPKPVKNMRIQAKRQRAIKKKRITELTKKLPQLGWLLHFDTIEIHWQGFKRYILTMIDEFTKIAFARMYKSKSSLSAHDFLSRVNYLLDGRVVNVHQDNGPEFAKYFQRLCQDLNIVQYHSRPKTPKDNPSLERFNQTLQYEWLRDGNLTSEVNLFNSRLTGFLVEYNFKRPHQALGYLTPIEFAVKYKQVSEMYPSSTRF